MADLKGRLAVERLRKARRQAGFRETNVWISPAVQAGLDEALANGLFKTRQEAIQHALVAAFVRKEIETVT